MSDTTSPAESSAAAGLAIQARMPSLTSAVVRRFKRELPPLGAVGVESMSDPVLADHTTTWIAEVATELLAHAAPDRSVGSLLADGRQIYLLLAELHGRQRAGYDWSEAAIGHEYAVLREEIARVFPADGGAFDAPLGELDRIVSESHEYALAALRRDKGTAESIEE